MALMDREPRAAAGADDGSSSGKGCDDSIKSSATPGRMVTLRDIENLRKKHCAQVRLDSNDALAVDKLIETLRSDDCILDYSSDGDDYFIGISTPFQRRMLKTFGSELVFMDAVHGLSIYGHVVLTLVVRDEFGNGVPVAFGITPSENGEMWKRFLSKTFEVSHLCIITRLLYA